MPITIDDIELEDDFARELEDELLLKLALEFAEQIAIETIADCHHIQEALEAIRGGIRRIKSQ